MINVMFWNSNLCESKENKEFKSKKIEEVIIDIAVAYESDIIVLVEFPMDTIELCRKLEKHNRFFIHRPAMNNKNRVKILARKFLKSKIIRESKYYEIHDFEWERSHFLIAGVHLPSKMYGDGHGQKVVSRDLYEAIVESQNEVKHSHIIVVGDFNANPFEEVMVSSEYLHAISDAKIVQRMKSRACYGIERQMLYNPMWNMLGDYDSPTGSYYYSHGGVESLYWNIFDQVLLSPSLIQGYEKNSLKIITSINHVVLVSEDGTPNSKSFSDHLPLVFSFKENLNERLEFR